MIPGSSVVEHSAVNFVLILHRLTPKKSPKTGLVGPNFGPKKNGSDSHSAEPGLFLIRYCHPDIADGIFRLGEMKIRPLSRELREAGGTFRALVSALRLLLSTAAPDPRP
jgi:hypothetical protein